MRKPEPTDPSTLGRHVVRFLAWCVLVAVVLFLGGTAAAIYFLERSPAPTSAFMIQSRTADPATGLPCSAIEYDWVDREHISPHLRLAVVLAEDQRFMLHHGIDFEGITRALKERDRRGRVRGASTLSQQLAKNLFLWPEPSWWRKGLEVWFTLWMEQRWSKQRILETYLNVAQFGPCVFGAEAASRRYFGRSADSLEPEQAALLATVLPSPKKLRAHNPGPFARQRTAEITQLMQELGRARHLRGL